MSNIYKRRRTDLKYPRLEEPIYVSGPMSYYPDFNVQSFHSACEMLRAMGYDVRSPHEVKIEGSEKMDGETKWQVFMRADLALLLKCKTVVTLPDWEYSRGAKLECYLADQLKMRVLSLRLALQT